MSGAAKGPRRHHKLKEVRLDAMALAEMRREKRLSPTDCYLLEQILKLADWRSDARTWTGPITELAEFTGMGRRTIAASIERLRDLALRGGPAISVLVEFGPHREGVVSLAPSFDRLIAKPRPGTNAACSDLEIDERTAPYGANPDTPIAPEPRPNRAPIAPDGAVHQGRRDVSKEHGNKEQAAGGRGSVRVPKPSLLGRMKKVHDQQLASPPIEPSLAERVAAAKKVILAPGSGIDPRFAAALEDVATYEAFDALVDSVINAPAWEAAS